MKVLILILSLLSLFSLISCDQIDPKECPAVFDFAKTACQERAGEDYRFAKCIAINKMTVSNGFQYQMTLEFIDRQGFLKYFDVNVYENPYWDNALTLNDIEEN